MILLPTAMTSTFNWATHLKLCLAFQTHHLRKYCSVHEIYIEDQPATKDEMFTSILKHWKRQVVDDKQVLRKFALTLQKSNAREGQ